MNRQHKEILKNKDGNIALCKSLVGIFSECTQLIEEKMLCIVGKVISESETVGEAENRMKAMYKTLVFDCGASKEFAFLFGELQLVFEKEKGKIKVN